MFRGRGPRAVLATLFTVAALAGGCGSDEAPAPTAPPLPEPPPVGPPPATLDLPDDPDHFFLEVWEGPGFVPIEYSLGRPPRYAATVGGELYHEGPTIEIFPGPLLPNIQRGRLSERIWIRSSRRPPRPGFPRWRMNSTSASRRRDPSSRTCPPTRWCSATGKACIGSASRPWAPYRTPDPRVIAVRELMQRLDQATADTAAESYSGERIQVYASVGSMLPEPSVLNERPWPLPDPPPEDDDSEFECRVYEGPVAADLLEIFADADHGTRWDFRGGLHQILARSLLPREEPCVR